MTDTLVISLDAMGGDKAPHIVVEGAALARERYPDVRFLMYGDEAQVAPILDLHPLLAKVTTIHHTDSMVRNEDKPSTALRSARDSSMRLAIDAVRDGHAAAVVSAGNTGALMAMAKFVLKTLPGIARPAIAGIIPTARGETAMLDLGANIQCDAENLVQFAVMGEVFARTVLGLERPIIGLLNIGVEDMKGVEAVREAAVTLRETTLPIVFKGFIEGNDITEGTVDVVVTDGFTGNVALKTAEGTASLYSGFLKEAFRSSWMAKLGYLFAKRSMQNLRTRFDPRRYNGAMLLGLNGIVVKSHGGTDEFGFANAIGVAVDMAQHGFIEKMTDDFNALQTDVGLPNEATG
ncbi:MAG: phosphate acyltransferase PlsX [Alphaproteobacteria bacterium]